MAPKTDGTAIGPGAKPHVSGARLPTSCSDSRSPRATYLRERQSGAANPSDNRFAASWWGRTRRDRIGTHPFRSCHENRLGLAGERTWSRARPGGRQAAAEPPAPRAVLDAKAQSYQPSAARAPATAPVSPSVVLFCVSTAPPVLLVASRLLQWG